MISQNGFNHLVQELVASVPIKVLEETEDSVDEVILESDIEGIHYYLVRVRGLSNQQINLSPRENTIAQLVAQGLPNKSIASQLDISPWTVATYLKRIFAKLGVTSRTAMVTKILGNNFLSD